MQNASLKLPADYWQNFVVSKRDIEFLQNHLFETENPLSEGELTKALVDERIGYERELVSKNRTKDGEAYLPKQSYKKGQKLIFPALNWRKGEIVSIRPGVNPQVGAFDVLEIAFEDGSNRLFAAGLAEHKLNQPVDEKPDPDVDPIAILEQHGETLITKLEIALAADESLVKIAGRWFPRALLVDINLGHLNLAEAVIEMAGGEPLSIAAIMEQVELPAGVNKSLTEFSLNYALQEDGRFDEVGPAGDVMWCLKRLEPEDVQQAPAVLRYTPLDYDRAVLSEQMLRLEAQLDDELSEADHKHPRSDETVLVLSYPHWRAGTLPISPRVRSFFPTAYESPRVRFTMVDAKTGERIPAWVVREHGYVYGLKTWFEKNRIIPGAQVAVRRSKNPGEVLVDARTHRPAKDWVRTVLAGSDGGVVFALLRQEVACEYHDRMVTVVPDVDGVDKAVAQIVKSRQPLERMIKDVLGKLSALTPQGHVHVEELYSAINILRRIPPAPLMAALAASADFTHVGDLYYRLSEPDLE